MAINKNDSTLLFYSKTIGVSFHDTLTLGRLKLNTTKKDITYLINKYHTNSKEINEVQFKDNYSEPLLELLGAKKIDSMDCSPYEKASIIHDLNIPISNELKNRYTAIIDGGTIEHVFNFPVAIKNCMNALKVGGHYIGISPTNNFMGHGFYQFSPELYFRTFSDNNGFKIKKMLLNISAGEHIDWYEISDPKIVGSRVSLINNFPICLMLIAEKVAEKNVFETPPQQIEYATIWNEHKALSKNKSTHNEITSKAFLKKLLPKRLKTILRNTYTAFFEEKIKDEFIGKFNPKHFIKTEI